MVKYPPFRMASGGTIWYEENRYFPDVDLNVEPDNYEPPAEGERENSAGSSAFTSCRTLGRFGIYSTFFGVAGAPGEERGDQLEVLVRQEQMITTHLVRQPGTTTGYSQNWTGKNNSHRMRESGTANAAFSTATILPLLVEASHTVDALYMGGCLKLEAFKDGYLQLPHLMSVTARLIVDHGRVPDNLSPELAEAVRYMVLHADYYLPSKDEFCTLWGVGNIEAGLRLLYSQAPNLTVIVKDGENGAYYYHPQRGVRRVPALPVAEITNLTGAGDNFNARFIYEALVRKQPLRQAIRAAHDTASKHIQGQPILL